jgi:hypothetical protein
MSTHPQAQPLTLFELRRYRARPGRRDELIAMFEAHFRAAYEAAGATILASWTVPDEPDRWVWIRAFTDAAARRRALEGFYGGEVWSRLGPACNATIADAREARVLRALDAPGLAHPPPREALPDVPARRWALTLLPLPAPRVGPIAPPPALVLGHDKAVVLLRRFDTAAAEAAFDSAVPARARHWRLHPTDCSRLR